MRLPSMHDTQTRSHSHSPATDPTKFSLYHPTRYAPNARSSAPFTAARNAAGATTSTSAPCRRMSITSLVSW